MIDEERKQALAQAVKREDLLLEKIEHLKVELKQTFDYGYPRERAVLLAKAILTELQLRLGRSDP